MAWDTVILNGSERPAPEGAQRIGEADPNEPVELTIVVRRRASFPENRGMGAPVSRAAFAEQYGAHPADLDEVEKFALAQGLSVKDKDVTRRSLIVTGTLGQLRTAFGADVSIYRKDGQTFRARTGTLTIPTELRGIIEGIFGLDERPQAGSRLRRRREDLDGGLRSATALQVSYSPPQIAQIYQFPPGNGAGQTIAIIELGGGFSDSDLAAYFSGLGIDPAPKVIAIPVDGASNAPTGDPNSADGEVLLDIEVAGAIASGATIAVYFAPNTTRGFLDAITSAIHDSQNNPGVISISWGGAESVFTAQALNSYDQAFLDAKALGITICVASGDDGSSDRQQDGAAHVDFPASSPNVLACGGTNLLAKDGIVSSETVWNEGTGRGASGGGVSETFPLPGYQASAGVPLSVNDSQFAGRGVPDVAGDADPNTGYQVLVDGRETVVGGTSAVAPLWAALVAVINQQLGKNVGFINPALYANAQGFTDITQGDNGAYAAGPGWDPCTGLGSPIGTAVLQILQAAGQATPPPDAPNPSDPENPLT